MREGRNPSRRYTVEAVVAAESVLAEIAELLAGYPEGWVVVGGMATKQTLDYWGQGDDYVGTTDVDIALDPDAIPEADYATIHQRLTDLGYRLRSDRLGQEIASSYSKNLRLGSAGDVAVQLDLLAPPQGAGRHRHPRIQDARARVGEGIDLAFRDPLVIEKTVDLPDRGSLRVSLRIAALPGLFASKAAALSADREKDAYDLYFLLRRYPGGPRAAVEELKTHSNAPSMVAAIEKLKRYFESPASVGPQAVVKYFEVSGDDGDRLAQDAYQIFQEVFHAMS